MNRNLWYALFALLFITLSCRPVLAIGWSELLFLSLLVATLLGPPLVRFLQRLGGLGKREKKDK